MNDIKISTGITENLNKLTKDAREDKKPIPNFKNKEKDSILEYLRYYEDNSKSKKNKGRKGLECHFVSKTEGVKTTDELIKYILKETKEIKFKSNKSGKGGEQPIQCWVTTFNDEAAQKGEIDLETFEKAMNDWIKHEICFLEAQGYTVLGYYEHEGEDTPHIHIVTKNWQEHEFKYTNQEKNADGSKRIWYKTRKICGSQGTKNIYNEAKKLKMKDWQLLKQKHRESLEQWIKKYPMLKLNAKGEETTLFAATRDKDSLLYKKIKAKEMSGELLKAILKEWPELAGEAGISKDKEKEILEILKRKDEEIKALKAQNKQLTEEQEQNILKQIRSIKQHK